jgi:hypothetical protein
MVSHPVKDPYMRLPEKNGFCKKKKEPKDGWCMKGDNKQREVDRRRMWHACDKEKWAHNSSRKMWTEPNTVKTYA